MPIARWAAVVTRSGRAAARRRARVHVRRAARPKACGWASAFAAAGIAAGDHVATMLHERLRFAPHDARARVAARGRGAARTARSPVGCSATRSTSPRSPRSSSRPSTPTRSPRWPDELPALQRIIVLDERGRAAFLAGGDPEPATPDGPEYRDVHSLMFTSGTTGPSKAVVTPWAVMYQFWSWVPDDTLAAGDGLYCTMPLFHNSGRSAFNYVTGPRRALRPPRQVQQRTLLGRRARHQLRDRRARRADDRVPRRRSPVARRRRQPAAERDRGADDPRDGGVRASLRRPGRDRVRADRGRHGRHHRLGPRPLGELRPPARGLPVARGPDRRRARRAGRAPARWAR